LPGGGTRNSLGRLSPTPERKFIPVFHDQKQPVCHEFRIIINKTGWMGKPSLPHSSVFFKICEKSLKIAGDRRYF